MEGLLYLILINALILAYAFIKKKGLYTVTPEKEWSKNLNEFDKNIKIINEIENKSNYKLSSNHIYNNH